MSKVQFFERPSRYHVYESEVINRCSTFTKTPQINHLTCGETVPFLNEPPYTFLSEPYGHYERKE
ncbi:MAG: hypothetical protein PHV20_13165 [Bacteroidales bacterium]|nr:hypothetical protein [Bacteroidales bacterium]